jgi:hypothetical protein
VYATGIDKQMDVAQSEGVGVWILGECVFSWVKEEEEAK